MEYGCPTKEAAMTGEKTGSGCIAIVPIFSALSPNEMAEVAAITAEKKFEKGELIYFAGKEGKKLFVLHTGRVKVSRINPTGKTQVIRVIGPGEFIGELSLLSQAALTDYAEALEPCVMCVVEGSRLKGLMKKYPSIALNVMEELSARLEKAERLIEDINLRSAEQRLAQALLNLAGDRREFELSLTKGDFASQLGMTQETLSRKLSTFQDKGLIGLKGQRRIIVLDAKGLADIE